MSSGSLKGEPAEADADRVTVEAKGTGATVHLDRARCLPVRNKATGVA
jgi:hypothetical protein